MRTRVGSVFVDVVCIKPEYETSVLDKTGIASYVHHLQPVDVFGLEASLMGNGAELETLLTLVGTIIRTHLPTILAHLRPSGAESGSS